MTTTPTTDELQQHALHAYRGIEIGLGEADPVAAVAAPIVCDRNLINLARVIAWGKK